jgi:hypothetical protein
MAAHEAGKAFSPDRINSPTPVANIDKRHRDGHHAADYFSTL